MKAGPKGAVQDGPRDAAGHGPSSRRETLDRVRAYYAISKPIVRKRVLDLLRKLAKPEV